MTTHPLSRAIFVVAALAFTACPGGTKCTTNSDCGGGQVCTAGTCVTGTAGGGGGGGGSMGGGAGGGGGGATNNGGETCEQAQLITPGTLAGNTTGLAGNYNAGCSGDAPGPDAVYRISVPAGQRLSVIATPELATSGNQFDLALYLIEAPASNCSNPDGGAQLTCLAASDHDEPLFESPETGTWVNPGTAPVDVFIVIDSYYGMTNANLDGGVGIAHEGHFTLVTTLTTPTAGDRCEMAAVLSTTTPVTGQDLANYTDDYGGTAECLGSPAGDAAWQVAVPPGQALSLVVTPDATFDVTVAISESAAACNVTCARNVDSAGDGEAETLTWKNTTTATQTLFIVIDGYDGSTGTFSIAATLALPPGDDVCAMPTALVSGTPLTAQVFTGYSNDYVRGTAVGCEFAPDADRAYSVTVPAGERLTLTATPTAAVDLTLNVIDGAANCGVTCLASEDPGIEGDAETLTFTNATAAAKTYLVVVDRWRGAGGTFDLLATVAAPPATDTCSTPATLVAGTPLTGQTTIGFGNDYQNDAEMVGCSSTGATGLDRVYQVSIPANQRGVVTVTPTADAGFNPSINLVEGAAAVCSATPRVCVAGANVAGSDRPESTSLYNATGAARPLFAIVDSATGGGPFDIAFTTATPVADDTCTTNTTTLAAGTRNDDLTGFGPDYASGAGCAAAAGPDRVYKVAMTANQKFAFTVTPTNDAGFDPVVNLIPGLANCEAAPRTCRASANATGAGRAESGAFTNSSGGPLDLFVVVADADGFTATNRDFSLVSTLAAATAGETCVLPQLVTAGALAAQSTTDATADVLYTAGATGCVGSTATPRFDKVYSVVVGANQTLTVTATPAAMEDLVINIIDGAASTCANVTACVASADMGPRGQPENVTFMNGTAAAKTVFVVITEFFNTPANFALNVQLQ